jgi:hypothetical protein
MLTTIWDNIVSGRCTGRGYTYRRGIKLHKDLQASNQCSSRAGYGVRHPSRQWSSDTPPTWKLAGTCLTPKHAEPTRQHMHCRQLCNPDNLMGSSYSAAVEGLCLGVNLLSGTTPTSTAATSLEVIDSANEIGLTSFLRQWSSSLALAMIRAVSLCDPAAEVHHRGPTRTHLKAPASLSCAPSKGHC